MPRPSPTPLLQKKVSSRIMQITSHMAPGRATSASNPQAAAAAAATATAAAAAPWRSLFLEHIEGMKTPQFTLSTIRRVPAASSSSSSGHGGVDDAAADGGYSYIPRARTCIFRGLWASLPVNPKNEAELNPDVYESDLPVFTTDVRMDKMAELWETGASAAPGQGKEEAKGREGSGGGGPVEAVFWAEDAMVQWRVRGRAYVLGPDVDDSEGGKETRGLLEARMRAKDGSGTEKGGQWSFAREITAHFGNLAPGMRGSFKNPPPGAPVALPVDDGLELGQKVTDLQDEVARKNFRVVVIVPSEVDRTDLSDPARGRRWLYRFVGASDGTGKPEMPGGEIVDGWEKVELWP